VTLRRAQLRLRVDRRQQGVAVVEFTLVSVVLMGVFLAVLQLAFVVHVRNTLTACAAEGARHAANLNRGLQAGEARTASLIEQSVSASFSDDITARYVTTDGVPLVEVTVRTTLPVIGLLGIERGMTVRGHAVSESGL
jgi:Flp pilus assembly protein TadG